ncbi:MAG: hypothetical protein CMH27_04760 [Micavibrio sp.]|mgnify:CR=1 FL=1|nr:hypothetical protein [Micavibrio sp.]|tara:strand:- start:2356 stop:3219 length:864 start_codon:yes stop_codon:yes gene_type:complete
MKKRILGAVSVLAIMAAAPAYADMKVDHQTMTKPEAAEKQRDDAVVTEKELKQGWEDTKKAVSDAADDVADATEETYDDIKAAFVSVDENTEIQNVVINERQTASNIIGATLYDEAGQSIAKVSDIILDDSGNASMVIVADGEIFGLGKKVAFDYSIVANQNADGSVMAPLTEEVIDQAAAFSYDPQDSSDNVRVMPANGFSVAELLDGQLVNQKGDALADVENISFNGAKAETLILGFNEVLGMGGQKAAMSFSAAQLIKNADGGGYDFQLNASQTKQFESYKNQF